MSSVDYLREQILTLPSHERATLATVLLASLESEPFEGDSQEAWKVEAESRAIAYSQGELTASDWRESVERVRQILVRRLEDGEPPRSTNGGTIHRHDSSEPLGHDRRELPIVGRSCYACRLFPYDHSGPVAAGRSHGQDPRALSRREPHGLAVESGPGNSRDYGEDPLGGLPAFNRTHHLARRTTR